MKRAAITGISGQDGTYLARWLLRRGYDVHGLLQSPFDREEPRLRARFGAKDVASVRWHTGSLLDPFSLARFFKEAKPDEIYHLAGLSDSRLSFAVPEESLSVIALGSLRVLEASGEVCGAARVFLASSCEVFGVPEEKIQTEKTPRSPITPYGIAKLAADQFARIYREKHRRFISVGLLYNHESPLRPPNYLSSRVARAVAAIKQGRQRELELGELSAERDWSDARDFIRGFWLALQAQAPGEFVFASGRRHTVADLVACAFKVAGLDHQTSVRSAPRTSKSEQTTTGLCGDPAKAQAELGWRPEWTFEQTIEDMVKAELEDRAALDRADPSPPRTGNL